MDIRELGFVATYRPQGALAVGGKIYFDDEGLCFKPHKYNFPSKEQRIDYSEMRAVETCKYLGFINNGVVIYTKDNNQHRFVTYSSKQLAEYIRSKI